MTDAADCRMTDFGAVLITGRPRHGCDVIKRTVIDNRRSSNSSLVRCGRALSGKPAMMDSLCPVHTARRDTTNCRVSSGRAVSIESARVRRNLQKSERKKTVSKLHSAHEYYAVCES